MAAAFGVQGQAGMAAFPCSGGPGGLVVAGGAHVLRIVLAVGMGTIRVLHQPFRGRINHICERKVQHYVESLVSFKPKV